MKKLFGRVYQLEEGDWKFGGEIQNVTGEKVQYSEFDSLEKYLSEEDARKAMIAYCHSNQLELIER